MPDAVVGGKALLVLKDNADNAKDFLLWKWLKGAATDAAEFGNPVNTDTYELCLYAGTASVSSATAPVDSSCDGTTCWKQTGSGFKYRDPQRSPDGLQTILLKAGADGKAKIVVRGKGVAMPDLDALASPLTVQLRRNGSSVCWGATYSFPPAIRNDAAQFKDKAD